MKRGHRCKMKRKWISISIVSLCLLSISFYKTYQESSVAVETTAAVQPNQEAFQIEEVPYITERIHAAYPQIIGGTSEKKAAKWNSIIKDDFDRILQIYSFDPYSELKGLPAAKGVILNISYQIKLQNDQFLSILYLANYNSPYSAHPTELVYTTNINTVKDTRLTLSDLIKLDSNFISSLRNWDFITSEPDNSMMKAVLKRILNDMSEKELLEGLKAADQINSNNHWGIYSYLTPNNFGVSIAVPHFAGDHVELEKSYEELKDYLNPDYRWNFNP